MTLSSRLSKHFPARSKNRASRRAHTGNSKDGSSSKGLAPAKPTNFVPVAGWVSVPSCGEFRMPHGGHAALKNGAALPGFAHEHRIVEKRRSQRAASLREALATTRANVGACPTVKRTLINRFEVRFQDEFRFLFEREFTSS